MVWESPRWRAVRTALVALCRRSATFHQIGDAVSLGTSDTEHTTCQLNQDVLLITLERLICGDMGILNLIESCKSLTACLDSSIIWEMNGQNISISLTCKLALSCLIAKLWKTSTGDAWPPAFICVYSALLALVNSHDLVWHIKYAAELSRHLFQFAL